MNTCWKMLRLGAFSAMLLAGGADSCPAQEVSGGPRNVGGAMIDDLPLIGPYLLPTQAPWESIRIAFRGTAAKTKGAAGAVHYGMKGITEHEVRFAGNGEPFVDLTKLDPDTTYQYRLELGGFKSPVYRFRTAPVPGTRSESLKIAVLMDVHAMEPLRLTLPNPSSKPMFFSHAGAMLKDLREFGPDMERVNPNGGAVAHGHPLGATGAALMTKLLYELERRDARFGLQLMCIGFGMAAGTVIERV